MLKTADLNSVENLDDYDRAMGMFALLGAISAFGDLKLNFIVPVLHAALRTGSYKIFLGENDRPSAGVIWAKLDDEAEEFYLNHGFLPSIEAWNSGSKLWFLHVIAEGGSIKQLLDDCVQGPLFVDYDRAYMLRVGSKGSRRVVEITRKGARVHRVLTPLESPPETD